MILPKGLAIKFDDVASEGLSEGTDNEASVDFNGIVPSLTAMEAFKTTVDSKLYRPPRLFRNPHIHTIYARYARERVAFGMERSLIDTPDGDVLEVDWARQGSDRVVILTHGLEGKSDAPYMRSAGRALFAEGCDVLAWNFRDCGPTPNRFLRSYHCGMTCDLGQLIELCAKSYKEIILIGFSVGGSLILKYLGEHGSQVDSKIVRAITISSPINLEDSADTLRKGINRIYLRYFLRSFKEKLRRKQELFPEHLSGNFFKGIRDFEDYDNRFTAPWFGFVDARSYWRSESCERYIPEVRVPTLFLTSQDDTFFTDKNIPWSAPSDNSFVELKVTRWGGHVAFMQGYRPERSWIEHTVIESLTKRLTSL